MIRRTLPGAATLTAAAVLLLTACSGGDDGSETNDKIAGADQGDKSLASPSASDGSSVKRPDVSVPKDLKLVFDWDEPSDPKQAAALGDAANYIRAIMHGVVKQDVNDPAYGFYSTSGAEKYAQSQIQTWVDGGWTATGTNVFYDPSTAPAAGGKAVLVSFCNNQAKAFSRKISTGKIHYTKESIKSYSRYRILMAKPPTEKGVWRAGEITVEGEAEQCRK
ncbi:hypothetical protein [Streptomyces sp. 8N616]|uniref:hypothetical protein n=1 Tax=Streptomyces sp. 8N616 TaxID=3457414 RepID=UPI003FD35A77